MRDQLSLFTDDAAICCNECGASLRRLDDLRGDCAATGGNHVVSTAGYMTLYRRTHEIVLA